MNLRVFMYPGFLGCVCKEDRDVNSFYEASKRVDGDEEENIFLLRCVVKPKCRAEESHSVRKRLKPFCCLLLPNPIERWPASISYNLIIEDTFDVDKCINT